MSDSCSSFCEQAVDGRKKKLIEKVFGWKKKCFVKLDRQLAFLEKFSLNELENLVNIFPFLG